MGINPWLKEMTVADMLWETYKMGKDNATGVVIKSDTMQMIKVYIAEIKRRIRRGK